MARVPARGLADVAGASTASDVDGLTSPRLLIRPDNEYIGERGPRSVPLGAQ